MQFILIGHAYEYEVQTMTQVFYPNERFEILKDTNDIPQEGTIVVSLLSEMKCGAVLYEDGKKQVENVQAIENRSEKDYRHLVKLTIFEALKKRTELETPWGMITGIRPSKIVHELWREGLSDEQIRLHLKSRLKVDSEKIDLCFDVARAETHIISQNNGNDFSLYVGIPFCPTRCLYCSFTSYEIGKYENIVDDYLLALEKEMIQIKEFGRNRYLETVYIGGGTPTSLNDKQLDFLLSKVSEHFNLNAVKEFSVEAGRPDTITESKLEVLKRYGVSRISINPQTMNDKTLKCIGRKHTVKQFLDAYGLARKLGFANINIDLILGLPGESIEDVEHTLKEIGKLKPESITVHTLAIKRGSLLKESLNEYQFVKMNEIQKMIDRTKKYADTFAMKPYYMYRQKNMLGNFENVGYCVQGRECIYNVQIMEERQTIVAIGAGASTKLVDFSSNNVERIFNVKSVQDYINRIDEMIVRKKRVMV